VGLVKRGEVYLVALDPTVGHEMQKTRPCLLVSPDEMNRAFATVIVAPMTTAGQARPTRVPLTFQRTRGFVATDQIRTVDRDRLVKRLGQVDAKTLAAVLDVLGKMFAP
jgi:mRNA interferase MazF